MFTEGRYTKFYIVQNVFFVPPRDTKKEGEPVVVLFLYMGMTYDSGFDETGPHKKGSRTTFIIHRHPRCVREHLTLVNNSSPVKRKFSSSSSFPPLFVRETLNGNLSHTVPGQLAKKKSPWLRDGNFKLAQC